MDTNQTTGTPETRPDPRAMDGWRIFTGIAALFLFWASIFFFAAADAEHRAAEKCSANGDWFCFDFSVQFRIVAGWMMALAGGFGLATLAPSGIWRRGLVIAAMCVLVSPVLIAWVVASPITLAVFLGVAAFFIILSRLNRRHPPDASEKGAGGDI